MIIEFAAIPTEGTTIEGEEPASVLDLSEADIRVESPVRYTFEVQASFPGLIVRGTVGVTMIFRCSKCAELFTQEVIDPAFECVREVATPNESVDLTDDIREAILLSFPNYPVCRPDCKGLCAYCGASLNAQSCRCGPKRDFRWHALDGLNPS